MTSAILGRARDTDAGVTYLARPLFAGLTETCLASLCLQARCVQPVSSRRWRPRSWRSPRARRPPRPTPPCARRSAVSSRRAGSRSGALRRRPRPPARCCSPARRPRATPASVEKLYTTATALLRFGPERHACAPRCSAAGPLDAAGTWRGNLYLRGGGDPTFGSASFAASNYGAGADGRGPGRQLLRRRAAQRARARSTATRRFFDRLRGTAPLAASGAPATSKGRSAALAFNRGFSGGRLPVRRPRCSPRSGSRSALRAVRRDASRRRRDRRHARRRARARARGLADDRARSSRLTQPPSDNFFAETLLKDLGARFGGAGTTAAGRRGRARRRSPRFGVHPPVVDGSGLSRADRTSPAPGRRPACARCGDGPAGGACDGVAGRSPAAPARWRDACAAPPRRALPGQDRHAHRRLHPRPATAAPRNGHTLAFAILMNGVDVGPRARPPGPAWPRRSRGRSPSLVASARPRAQAREERSQPGLVEHLDAQPLGLLELRARRSRRRRGSRSSSTPTP